MLQAKLFCKWSCN